MIRSLGGRTPLAHAAPPVAIPRPIAASDAADVIGAGLPAYLETFDQADSTTLGPVLDWVTHISGGAQLKTVSNELTAIEVTADPERYLGWAYPDQTLPSGDMYAQIEVTGIDAPFTSPPNVQTLHQGFAVGVRQPNDSDRVAHVSSFYGFWLVIQRFGDDPWQATLTFGGLPYGHSLVDGSGSGLPYAHGVELTSGLTVGDVIRVEIIGAGGAETVNAVQNGTVVDTRDTSLISPGGTVLADLADTYGRYSMFYMDVWGTPGNMTFDNFEFGALGTGTPGDAFLPGGIIDGGGA